MEYTTFQTLLEAYGFSPVGAMIGFTGSLVGTLVINANGMRKGNVALSVLSAVLLCGAVWELTIHATEIPAIRFLATLYTSILAPDLFTALSGTGKTISERLLVFLGDFAKGWWKAFSAAFNAAKNQQNNE